MSHLIGLNIADIHFGAMEPSKQYDILYEQFISVAESLPQIDYIAICGDIFHKKFMANSDAVYYATLFVDECVNLAFRKKCPLIILAGTMSHDAGQLKLFWHYIGPDNDVHIVDSIKFLNIKGCRFLCIPELYDIPEEEYDKYLHKSGWYDVALIHGTFEGAVYNNTVGNGRLFTFADFDMCTGMMISGHVHKPGCFKGYYYYCGSPYRWCFGEEHDKGFLISVLDTDTNMHYIQFCPIQSDTYITLDINEIISSNPKDVIEYINRYKIQNNIDYLKIKFNIPINGADKVIIDSYYRNNGTTFVEFLNIMEERRIQKEQNGIVDEMYDFILDNRLSDFEKFVKYVNIKEGAEFLTVDKLKEILAECV